MIHQESQSAAVPELPNNQPHQSPRQGHAEDHTGWLKTQVKKIIAEELAGFRAGRSTTEQIFNPRIFCKKYLQHQHDLHHIFIDFKKTLTGFGMQLYGQQRSITPVPTLSESSNSSMIRPPVQSSSTAARRLVLNNSSSLTRMSSLTHPLQHISGKDHDRCLRRS